MKKVFLTILLISVLAESCSPKSTATPLYATPTLIFAPTPTSIPATATSTNTPVPTATPEIVARDISGSPQALTPPPYYQYEGSAFRKADWSANGNLFALAGDSGVYIYNAATLTRQAWLPLKVIVNSVRFSPDGNYLASDNGKTITIWDVSNQKSIYTFYGHDDQVLDVAFSPDGKWLATAGADKIINIWESATRRQVFRLKGHTDWVNSIVFSPDSNKLASASMDGTVRVWNVLTGENINTIAIQHGEVYAVAFSPSGDTFVSGGADGMIRIWDAVTFQQKTEFYGDSVIVTKLAYSPNGKWMAWGGLDGRIRLRNVVAEQSQSTVILTGHEGVILGLAFNPNSIELLSTGSEGTAKIWNLSTLNGR